MSLRRLAWATCMFGALGLGSCAKPQTKPEPAKPPSTKKTRTTPLPEQKPQPGVFLTYQGEPFVADQTGPVVEFVDGEGVSHFVRRPDADYRDRPECDTCAPREGLSDPVYEKSYDRGVVLQIGPGRVTETVTRNCSSSQTTACLAQENLAAGQYRIEVSGVLECRGRVRVPIQDEVVLKCERGI